MATAATSTFSTYRTPVLTQRCGDVYYSLNLDTFFVNCQKCSEEFNLLSSDLYIKHIKECLAYVLHELNQQNLQTLDPLHPTTSYVAKAEVQSTPYEPHVLNPPPDHLITIKQENLREKDNAPSYSQDNDHTMDCDNNFEQPLKKENRKECEDDKDMEDGGNGDNGEDNGEDGVTDDDEESDEDDCTEPANPLTGRKKNKVMITLIDEYKKHPCLWNEEYRTHGKYRRYDAYQAMADAINEKHSQDFTKEQIRNKVVQLRSTFKRVLRNKLAYDKKHADSKKKKKTLIPTLWYFKRFMFIEETTYDWGKDEMQSRRDVGENVVENVPGLVENTDQSLDNAKIAVENPFENIAEPVAGSTEENAFENVLENAADNLEHEEWNNAVIYNALEAEVLLNLDEISSDSKLEEVESSTISKTCITKNKSLLSAVVDEYKIRPPLWQMECSKDSREKDLTEVCVAINERFNTNLTSRTLDREMSAVISLYKKSWRQDVKFKWKIWLAELLPFINVYDPEPNDLDQGSSIYAENDSQDDSSSDEESQEYNNGSPISNKEKVFKIIQFLKESPILWDTKHPRHRSRLERKKCTDEILAKLSQEHDCHLTTEEFRFQVQYLKNEYIRAERLPGAEKPFFFEEMSFLKPYAKINPLLLFEEPKSKPKFFQFLYDDKPLMLKFIEVYKAHNCLWDGKHKDRNNPLAREVAYNALMELFQKHGRDFNRKRLRSAIKILHTTVTYQRAMEKNGKKNENDPPVWFYEHLDFLRVVPKLTEKFCLHCNTLFYSLEEYKKHKREIAGEDPYKCAICNIGFSSRSQFSYHRITHRNAYKCTECKFKTFDVKLFNVHMRRHKRILAFNCEECGKGFVTLTEVHRHQRTHEGGKKFICEQCGKALGTNAEYQDHIKRHRNQRDFKCDICGMAFFTWNVCRDHKATHSTERKHVCETCGKAFKRKKSLVSHMALHRDEKKYKCRFCDKAYAQPSGLHAHLKKH